MFEGEDRYARNDLKLWLEAHGPKGGGHSPQSTMTSPAPNKEHRGGKGEGEGRHAIETGTS